jgi:hypothetical protein
MILQNNSCKSEAKVSLKAKLYTLHLMILQKIHAKAISRSRSQNSLSDDTAKN